MLKLEARSLQRRVVHNVDSRHRVADVLIEENHRSLKSRYGEKVEIFFDESTHLSPYAFSDLGYISVMPKTKREELSQVLYSIKYYEYQTCESDTWETSEAKKFCDELRNAVINRLCEGLYWGAPDLREGKSVKIYRGEV